MIKMIMRISFMWVFFSLAPPSFSQATAFFSIQDGSWHDMSTWTNLLAQMRVPGTGDHVHVRHDVAVTQSVDAASFQMQGGGLEISTGMDVRQRGGTGTWHHAHIGGSGTFRNEGQLTITGAPTTVLGGPFLNLGLLTMVETPSLQVNGPFYNMAQATTVVGRSLSHYTAIQGSGSWHNAGTLFTDAGTTCMCSIAQFNSEGGVLWLGADSQFQVNSSRGTNVNGFFILETNSVFLPVSGGTNRYSGNFSSAGSGSFLMREGTLQLGFFGESGASFNIQGGGFNWLGGVMQVNPSYTLQNQGNMTIGGLGGTTQLLQGALVNSGFISIHGATGSGFNVAGGYITNEPSGAISFAGANPALIGSTFYNAGQVNFAADGTTSIQMAYINCGGTSTFERGWANLYGEMYAGLFLLNGGYWGGGQSFYLSGGSVAGAGQIANNMTQSSGVLSPGQSAGQLEITGHFSQTTTNATLLMEVGGTEAGGAYDQVVVGGTGAVSGVLTIELLEGYQPPPATRFDLVLASEVTGLFASTNLPALADDHFWLVRYFTNAVQLRVATPTDTDGDGLLDAWELGYFETLEISDGGACNSDDDAFTDWQEYIADTNPTNSTSYLRVFAMDPGPPVAVHFTPGSTGRVYSFQCTDNLTEGSWTNVPGALPRPGDGGDDLMTDTNQVPLRSHRIKVELP
ncbi:MAG: hypothetical protein EOM20_16640 [Spartobacteria bacterium]|nr:hypothetical protein [Spartobacteria bacterium]